MGFEMRISLLYAIDFKSLCDSPPPPTFCIKQFIL